MVIGAFGGHYGSQAGWAVVRDYIAKHILAARERSMSGRSLAGRKNFAILD
jgi:hypothetical protein